MVIKTSFPGACGYPPINLDLFFPKERIGAVDLQVKNSGCHVRKKCSSGNTHNGETSVVPYFPQKFWGGNTTHDGSSGRQHGILGISSRAPPQGDRLDEVNMLVKNAGTSPTASSNLTNIFCDGEFGHHGFSHEGSKNLRQRNPDSEKCLHQRSKESCVKL